MVDSGITANSLADAWTGFGRRIAVAAAALIGLVSLLAHAPVWLASLRGAATFVALAATARLARLALEYADHSEPLSDDEELPETEPAAEEATP